MREFKVKAFGVMFAFEMEEEMRRMMREFRGMVAEFWEEVREFWARGGRR